MIKADGCGWTSARTLAGFAVAVVLIAAFVVIERRHEDPLVPLRIFSNRSTAGARLQRAQDRGRLPAADPDDHRRVGAGVSVRRPLHPKAGARRRPADLDRRLLTRVSGHSDYASHVLPAMVVLGAGLGTSFVPITIAATNGVAAGDSGLASGLLNTTHQVGGSLGLAILSSVTTSRVTRALHTGAPLPTALTHGFKGAFTVAAALCAVGVVVALALLPGRQREAEDGHVEAIALSFARCPGAPYCGHLARVAAFGRRVRGAVARS